MADQYYCVKCKTKREMKDPQKVIMKNGKPALKGQCAVCGTTINTILSSEKKRVCSILHTFPQAKKLSRSEDMTSDDQEERFFL